MLAVCAVLLLACFAPPSSPDHAAEAQVGEPATPVLDNAGNPTVYVCFDEGGYFASQEEPVCPDGWYGTPQPVPGAVIAEPQMMESPVPDNCDIDPNGDGEVDVIGDLSVFASAAFTPNPPPHLDIDPLLGDGDVDVIGELSLVASEVFTNCLHGIKVVSPAGDGGYSFSANGQVMANPPSGGPFICSGMTRPQVWGWDGGFALVNKWIGGIGCINAPPQFGPYTQNCLFSFSSLIPGPEDQWELTGVTTPPGGVGNDRECIGNGFPAFLPCGRLVMGGSYHYITTAGGVTIHGPHFHFHTGTDPAGTDSAFNPC